MSQTDWVAKELKRGRRLTPMDALNDAGIFRLGARIWECRQRGMQIHKEMVQRHSKFFAEYRLAR